MAACASTVHAGGLKAVATPTRGGFTVKQNGSAAANERTHLTVIQGGAAVGVVSAVSLPLAPSVLAEVAVTGAISGVAAGGAWGAAIGAVGAVALAALPAIAEWMQRAGVRVKTNGTLEAQDPASHPGLKCLFNGSWARDNLNPFAYEAYQGYDKSEYGCRAYSLNDGADAYGVIKPAPENVGANVVINKDAAVVLMSAASPTPAAVQALVDLNFPPDIAPVSITGPASVFLGNTVKLDVDGSTLTEDTYAKLSFIPDTVTVDLQKMFTKATPAKTRTTQETVTITNPDGTTSTQVITRTVEQPASTSTTSITTPKAEAGVCGLPGGPACKIDEAGTPDGKDSIKKNDLEIELGKAIDALPTIVNPVGKDTSWGVLPAWTNQGPCAPWHVFTFPESVGSRSVDVDLCPLKPWADGISNFVWVALGFMGITSMVFATMTSKAN